MFFFLKPSCLWKGRDRDPARFHKLIHTILPPAELYATLGREWCTPRYCTIINGVGRRWLGAGGGGGRRDGGVGGGGGQSPKICQNL